jgi:hypothetical protein
MIDNLVHLLAKSSYVRKQSRRKLCKYLRENSSFLKDDYWITRKIRCGYLGDLSDKKLLAYIDQVRRRKNE